MSNTRAFKPGGGRKPSKPEYSAAKNLAQQMKAAAGLYISYIIFCVAHYFNLRKVCKNNCEGNQVFTAGYTLGISVAFLVLVFAMMALYEHRIMRFALAAGLCAFAFYKRDFIKWLLKSKKQD